MKFYIGSSFKNAKMVNEISEALIKNGWEHTYNWAINNGSDESKEEMITYSHLELDGIIAAEVIIILLPGGRGTHVELGVALAHHKKIYLCSANEDEFSLQNTVNFYELPSITQIVGTKEQILERILKDNERVMDHEGCNCREC